MGYGLLEQIRDLLKHAADEKRDTFFTAKEIIALVEADVAKRLLHYKTLNEGVSKSFDREDGARTHLVRAVIPMLHHIGIDLREVDLSDEWRAREALAAIGIEPSHE